ncbi:EamA family transporter [Massilia sp. TS11]|uniref:EamA family transporter n=1 Tax=Massilia sp. TS11 TaxID=2908003 RepID=UPI001EDB5CAF|nr:EamA family transporter [Massilia sp. TS11]MCG2584488.1 EamA family transporter [Massilia sp. TS11]
MSLTDVLTALAVVAIWGTNFVVIKIGLQDLPPLLFSALRFLFAALPMVLFVRHPGASWRLVAAYGLFQFTLEFALLFIGMRLGMPAGLTSLVIQLQAFFTIGMAVLLLGERPHWLQLAGAAIAFGGMLLVAAHLDNRATLLGFSLVVLSAISWGAANIVTKKMAKVDAVALMVWGSLYAMPPLFLASLLFEGIGAWQTAWQHASWRTVGAVLYQSYPNTILCFGLWSLLMKRYPAATIAPFALLVPVTGMASSALFLGERLHWWVFAAGALVLAGLVLNLYGPRWQALTIKAPPTA